MGTAASQTQAAAQGAVPDVGAAGPGVPVASGRKGFKAELDDLRERMRRLGLGYDEIAAAIGRRYRVRPPRVLPACVGLDAETRGGAVQRPCRARRADCSSRYPIRPQTPDKPALSRPQGYSP